MSRYLPSARPHHGLTASRSRGAVTLFTAIALLIVVTIITLGSAFVVSREQKSAANEVRAQEAGAIGDDGLGRGINYLGQNREEILSIDTGGWMAPGAVKWANCGTSINPPCGDGKQNIFDNTWTAYANVTQFNPTTKTDNGLLGVLPLNSLGNKGSFITHYVMRAASAGANAPASSAIGAINVISEGTSVDGLGKSLIRQAVVFKPILNVGPVAPLMATGVIADGGNLSVVPNPDAGGPGVPLSAWSGGNTRFGEGGASAKVTCYLWEYLNAGTGSANGANLSQCPANPGTNDYPCYVKDKQGVTLTLCPACTCPQNDAEHSISTNAVENIDILDVESPHVGVNPDSTYFPPDVFEYLLGVPQADYQQIKDKAQIITSCSSLGPASKGLIWINGTCDIPSGTTVGSLNDPVLLVVENSLFKMNANSQFFGMPFVFAHDGGATDVQMNGGPTLYGALVSNQDINMASGAYTVRYSSEVMAHLGNPLGSDSELAIVPGSWKNYN